MGCGLERRCVGRVYGADGAVPVSIYKSFEFRTSLESAIRMKETSLDWCSIK